LHVDGKGGRGSLRGGELRATRRRVPQQADAPRARNGLPKQLHELTAATWEELNKLADPGGDAPEVHEALDQLREAYVDLYEESAAISRSSVVAAEQRLKRQRNDAPPAPPTGADRIPHGVRAAIPPSVRRRLRRVAGRERPA